MILEVWISYLYGTFGTSSVSRHVMVLDVWKSFLGCCHISTVRDMKFFYDCISTSFQQSSGYLIDVWEKKMYSYILLRWKALGLLGCSSNGPGRVRSRSLWLVHWKVQATRHPNLTKLLIVSCRAIYDICWARNVIKEEEKKFSKESFALHPDYTNGKKKRFSG